MALFRVTVKRSANVGGIRLEKGMSVEIPTTGYNPLTSNGGNDVAMAFMRIYGLDLKRAGACHLGYLDVTKIGQIVCNFEAGPGNNYRLPGPAFDISMMEFQFELLKQRVEKGDVASRWDLAWYHYEHPDGKRDYDWIEQARIAAEQGHVEAVI